MPDSTTANGTPIYFIVLITFTTVAAILAGVYFSGYADDTIEFIMKKFFKAKAKAEMIALEKAGEGQAQDFLKGRCYIPLSETEWSS
jgi:hypothetical protein